MEPTEPLTEDRRDPAGDPARAAAEGRARRRWRAGGRGLPGRDRPPRPPRADGTPARTAPVSPAPSPSNFIRRSSVALVADPRARLLDISIPRRHHHVVWESRDKKTRLSPSTVPTDRRTSPNQGQLLVSVVTAPGGLLVHRADYYKVGVLRTSAPSIRSPSPTCPSTRAR